MRRTYYPRIVLKEDIDFNSLAILLSHGLAVRCRDLYDEWRTQRGMDEARFSQEEENAASAIHNRAQVIYQRLGAGLAEWLADETIRAYP